MTSPSSILVATVGLVFLALPSPAQQPDSANSTAPGIQLTCLRPTADQLAHHSWLRDSSLSTRLAEYSAEVANLVQSEQRMLNRCWWPSFRRGEGIVNPQDETTAYKWEFIDRTEADEYRLKRTGNPPELRLVLMPKSWLLLGGDDYSQLIAKGDIGTP